MTTVGLIDCTSGRIEPIKMTLGMWRRGTLQYWVIRSDTQTASVQMLGWDVHIDRVNLEAHGLGPKSLIETCITNWLVISWFTCRWQTDAKYIEYHRMTHIQFLTENEDCFSRWTPRSTNVRLRRAKGETSSRAGEHWGAASVVERWSRWSHSDMMQRACKGLRHSRLLFRYWHVLVSFQSCSQKLLPTIDHIFFFDSQLISLP